VPGCHHGAINDGVVWKVAGTNEKPHVVSVGLMVRT